MPHYGTRELPTPRIADAAHMPAYHDHRGSRPRQFVGVDQGDIGSLPRTGDYDGVEIRFGTLADGAGKQAVSSYLSQAAQVPIRWDRSPVVTYSGHATDKDFARLVRAVQLVNTALPDGRKMRIASSSPRANPENGIHVEFVLERDFSYPEAWGIATAHWQGNTITHSNVLINEAYAVTPRDETSSFGPAFDPPTWGFEQVNRQGTIVLAHELIHALGMTDHVSAGTDSIMRLGDIYAPQADQPLSLLYELDREALRALYGAFGDGDTLADFGPWASTALHFHGNGPHAGFGVALRNGYAEPWAYGYRPDSDFAANGALSGNATWNGVLLGLTPGAAAVAGNAAISVNMASMIGSAGFTNLETWGADVAPGAEGTGTTWGDGDLRYSIAVRGNAFRETGGDAGRLTGIFTGAGHEGAAGTLERSDLTAAFGASRE